MGFWNFMFFFGPYIVVLCIAAELLQRKVRSNNVVISDFFKYTHQGRKRVAMLRNHMVLCLHHN